MSDSSRIANTSRDESTEERKKSILRPFVLRARRVEAHSLMSDPVLMSQLARGTFRIEGEGEKVFISESFPPEEQIESLAARVRPLILQRDSTHHAKVLGALGYFVNADDELSAAVKSLRTSWNATRDESDKSGRFVQMLLPDGRETRRTGDRELAYAYIYGDVVHHDGQRLATVADFDIDKRYRSAVPLVAQLALLTMATLSVVKEAEEHGLVSLGDDVWASPVVATQTTFRTEGRVMLAEVGTAVPVGLNEAFGPEWKDIRSVGLPPRPSK